MATITIDASSAGYAQAITLKSKADSNTQLAEVFVTPSGTYDRDASESIEITNIATLIAAHRRNGKTVTLIGATPGQSTLDSSGNIYRWNTAVINSTTVDGTIYDETNAAEYADDTALPTLLQPMSVVVSFTEA